MNKTLMYVLVGVGAVVVVGGAIYMSKGEPGTNQGYTQDSSAPASMRELLAKGGSQECNFESTEGGAESSGVVYVNSGKMRGDFVSVSGGQRIESHMIVNGDVAYVWSDAMNQGMKMSLEGMYSAQNNQSGSVDMNEKVDYDCKPWAADQSKFAEPNGVTFIDLNAAIQSGAGLY